MNFKYTHAMAALSIALVSAPSANANIIIENLYITNPDGTTVDGEEWDNVSFTWNDQTVPLLGVRGENGKNYVYLDVDISAETDNNPSPSITVEHGLNKRVVKANWSIDKHAMEQVVATQSLSDYKILGRPDLVPRYMNIGESIALCPATRLGSLFRENLDNRYTGYVLIAVETHRDTATIDMVSKSSESVANDRVLVFSNDLYASPYNAPTLDGNAQYYPSSPEWSLATGTDFQASMARSYMDKTIYGHYITAQADGQIYGNTAVNKDDITDTSLFMGQLPDECIGQSTLEQQHLLPVTYGNPPSHPGAAIPVVF